jgi:outer membrane lipoprotein SlyB
MTTSSTRPFSPLSFRFCLSVLLFCAIGVSGCSSKYGAQQTKINHYPDCYEPIAELRDSEYSVERSTVAGSVIGGLLGALGGYLATGKTSGAIAGAAVGAVGGGAVGHYSGKSSQEQKDDAALSDYAARLDVSTSNLDKTTAAARVARLCYERQFNVAVSEFKSGHINKEQFRSRYQEVASGLQEAAFILGENNRQNLQVAAQYQQAVDAEAERMGIPKQLLQAKTSNKTNSRTAVRDTNLSKAEQQHAAAKLKTSEGQQLAKAATEATKMEEALNDAQTEENQLRDRLAATRKAAEDLMS